MAAGPADIIDDACEALAVCMRALPRPGTMNDTDVAPPALDCTSSRFLPGLKSERGSRAVYARPRRLNRLETSLAPANTRIPVTFDPTLTRTGTLVDRTSV